MRILIAAVLGVLLALAYVFSLTVNTAVVTPLPVGGFALGYVLLALLAGFIGWSFATALQNRFVRRLVLIGCMVLVLYAGGNAWRAMVIARLYSQPLVTHPDAMRIVRVGGGAIGLRSPYTTAVFDMPTTIAPASDFAGFAYATKCARVQIEETPGGDKRIVKGGAPIAEADIVACPAR